MIAPDAAELLILADAEARPLEFPASDPDGLLARFEQGDAIADALVEPFLCLRGVEGLLAPLLKRDDFLGERDL